GRTDESGAGNHLAGARRRPHRARGIDPGACPMSKYQKPAELYDGLRLHQNENTAGCSPRVLEALATLRAEEVGFYPPYEAATRACAEYIGVHPDHLSLLNGLDEGIMSTAIGYLR